ncbi:MAG: Xaa-Pro dipeptidase [Xanthomonadales bacterium]|jgi:Xaa-Pro dipeptidase|nr:Xaa-Pro dipeptidase [Xanthomonadales bacterium]
MTSETITQHYADHVARQQRAWEEAMAQEGFDSVIVHAGSAIVSFLDDYHYPFRPNPHFLAWLPLVQHEECVLIVRPGFKPVLYFYQPDDYWHLPPSDPESWWAQHFDVRVVREPGTWHQGVPVGREAYLGDAPELEGEDEVNPPGLINRLHLARTRKTPYELACLRESSALAARCHRAAEEAFLTGCSEYEIHQAYLAAGELDDASLPYGSIVALNGHGAVLHYQHRDRARPESSHSFLIDAGAAIHAYCSDITRTYTTAEGAFADLISAMDQVQRGLCADMTAGTDYSHMHLRAHQDIAGVLADAKIVLCDADTAVETGLSRVFFPHGLGHYLGLQTHDVAGLLADETGEEIPRPPGHPYLRLTRVLEPGNVLTVEPGLYFIDSLLDDWRGGQHRELVNWDLVESLKPYGGIRIEDDVVVTDGAPENLSREAFAALD